MEETGPYLPAESDTGKSAGHAPSHRLLQHMDLSCNDCLGVKKVVLEIQLSILRGATAVRMQ